VEITVVRTDAADFSFPAFFADTLVRVNFVHTCSTILTGVQLAVIDVCNEQKIHKLMTVLFEQLNQEFQAEFIKPTFQLHRLLVLHILCYGYVQVLYAYNPTPLV
jgi:hypothetical protein